MSGKQHVMRLVGLVTLTVAATGGANAQSTGGRGEVPDYAAVLGTSQVVVDPVSGKRRGLIQKEIEQRLNARGERRSAQQRSQSRAVNESLHAMPVTVAEAFRAAKPNAQGIVVVKTAREQIQPIVGVLDEDGTMKASHDPADTTRENSAGDTP